MEIQKSKEEIVQEFNDRLKNLRTYEELKQFLADLDDHPTHHLELQSKRTRNRKHNRPYSFSHLYEHRNFDGSPSRFTENPRYLNRVHYLYDDSVSTGESDIKSLYRHLTVKGY